MAKPKHLKRADLVREIAERYEPGRRISNVTVTEILAHFLDAVVQHVTEDGVVQINDFGTFSLGSRAKRRIMNVVTGKHAIVPAKKHMKFTCSPSLSKRLSK